MSAAEALPPISPWRDTSQVTNRLPTAADLKAAPPPNQAGRAVHDANVAKLTTQAAWQAREAAEPFEPAELHADRLDELEGIWEGVFAQGYLETSRENFALLAAQYQRVEKLLDWPQNELERWS